MTHYVITRFKHWGFSDIEPFATRGDATLHWLDLANLYIDDNSVEIKMAPALDVIALRRDHPEWFGE